MLSPKDITKSLKVNKMLVWKTIKRFNKAGHMKNRYGQVCPQNPRADQIHPEVKKKSEGVSQKSCKRGKCVH